MMVTVIADGVMLRAERQLGVEEEEEAEEAERRRYLNVAGEDDER